MEQYKYVIYGKVQNVCYRATTKKEALTMYIKGWVKNNPDKTVTVLAQYKTKEQKIRFEAFLKIGSEYSIVKKITKEKIKEDNQFCIYDSFEIVI